jgi:acyl carrier protein
MAEALMSDVQSVKSMVFAAIADRLENKVEISDDTQLIGDGSVLDSISLVELCLQLEDKASELGFQFDWTSEAAMSKLRGMFRTAGALSAEFSRQMEDQR